MKCIWIDAVKKTVVNKDIDSVPEGMKFVLFLANGDSLYAGSAASDNYFIYDKGQHFPSEGVIVGTEDGLSTAITTAKSMIEFVHREDLLQHYLTDL
jgi:hypothetical protein